MAKYIDAEKLITEIERLIKVNQELKSSRFTEGIAAGYGDVLSAITSLQQEQPEVDLEKEMDKFYGIYRDDKGETYDVKDNEPCFDWKEDELAGHELHIAIHFYVLGLNERKEEDK
jgi:hypothetical protein